MFEVTSRAAAALAERRARTGLDGSVAIRISMSRPGDGPSPGYQLRFALMPSPDDLVIESAGTTVFLAAGLADRLIGSVLDVVDTPQGEQLLLKHRSSAGQ